MINKLVKGRLGNQMFQYAAVRAFREYYKLNDKINLNFSLLKKEGSQKDGFENSLKYFNLDENIVTYDKKIKLNIFQIICKSYYNMFLKFILYFSKNGMKVELLKRKIQPLLNKNGIYIYCKGFYDIKNSKVKNKIFLGYFESEKYFKNISDILKKEFTPKYDRLNKNKKLYEIIESNESVCISIRRGDFLSDKYRDKHFVCTDKYFKKAIEEMIKKVPNCRFIVFSDDIEYVKKIYIFQREQYLKQEMIQFGKRLD